MGVILLLKEPRMKGSKGFMDLRVWEVGMQRMREQALEWKITGTESEGRKCLQSPVLPPEGGLDMGI